MDFEYLSIPLINSTWLAISLLYLGKIKKFFSLTSLSIYIIPFITILIRLTNSFHHGFSSDAHLVPFDTFWLIKSTPGFGYYIQIIYAMITTFAVIFMFIFKLVRSGPSERKKFAAMLIASILPLIAVFISVFDPFDLPLDYTALTLPISVFILAISIITTDKLQLKSKVRFDLFQSSTDGHIIIGQNNIIVDFNQIAEEFFKHHNVHLNRNSINSEFTVINQNKDLQEIFNNNEDIFEFYSFEHDEYWEITTRMIKDKSDKINGRLKTLYETTSKVKSRLELEKLSKTDELSTLNNRRELMDQGKIWVQQNRDLNTYLAVIFFDIDFFKKVNDTFGHSVGDDVIRNIGALLRKRFRSTDIVTRYGGEEFVVMIKVTSNDEAHKLALRTLKDIEDFSFIKADPSYKLTVSAGIAFAHNDDNLETLIDSADKAMYQAKQAGRNQVCIHKLKERSR